MAKNEQVEIAKERLSILFCEESLQLMSSLGLKHSMGPTTKGLRLTETDFVAWDMDSDLFRVCVTRFDRNQSSY